MIPIAIGIGGRQFSASLPASREIAKSCSCKPLQASLADDTTTIDRQADNLTEKVNHFDKLPIEPIK